MDSCLFLLCLDEYEPKDKTDWAKFTLAGDSKNRWYDKPLTIIVADCKTMSYLGMNMEHAFVDASVVEVCVEYVQIDEKYENGTLPSDLPHGTRDIAQPIRLEWNVSGMVESINTAAVEYKSMVSMCLSISCIFSAHNHHHLLLSTFSLLRGVADFHSFHVAIPALHFFRSCASLSSSPIFRLSFFTSSMDVLFKQ